MRVCLLPAWSWSPDWSYGSPFTAPSFMGGGLRGTHRANTAGSPESLRPSLYVKTREGAVSGRLEAGQGPRRSHWRLYSHSPLHARRYIAWGLRGREIKGHESECWSWCRLCCLPGKWLWASDRTSFSLSFLICHEANKISGWMHKAINVKQLTLCQD